MADRLAETIHYIAHKSIDDPAFGATKLNKILFTVDFWFYGISGQPISGDMYVHRKFGPVPSNLVQARNNLVNSGRAYIRKRTYFGKPQDVVTPAIPPDTSVFSSVELQFIDQVIESLKEFNGTQLSNWTHELRPWLDSIEGEEIPYFTVFGLENITVSREDLEWGERKLQELKAAGYAPI